MGSGNDVQPSVAVHLGDGTSFVGIYQQQSPFEPDRSRTCENPGAVEEQDANCIRDYGLHRSSPFKLFKLGQAHWLILYQHFGRPKRLLRGPGFHSEQGQ